MDVWGLLWPLLTSRARKQSSEERKLLSYCSFSKISHCHSIFLSRYLFIRVSGSPHLFACSMPLCHLAHGWVGRLCLQRTNRHLKRVFLKLNLWHQVGNSLSEGHWAGCMWVPCCSLPAWWGAEGSLQCSAGTALAGISLSFGAIWSPLEQLLLAAGPTWSLLVLVVQGSVQSQAQIM